MVSFLSVFLLTLGLGQLISTYWQLRGASLAGASYGAGYGVGLFLLISGAMLLPPTWSVLWWALLCGPLVVVVLLWGGSYIAPPQHPNQIFSPEHPAHNGCQPVNIPDGDSVVPGLLLFPLNSSSGQKSPAVCIVPGAGDNKTFFKWSLVQTFLDAGFVVLTIDIPGHGDNKRRPLTYPQCLSAVPAAVDFLHHQPDVSGIGLVGVSLGGALSLNSLAENSALKAQTDALVIVETPTRLHFTRLLFYKEVWGTLYGSPVLPLLKEISVKQIWQGWRGGGYYSPHTVDELITFLNPVENIQQLADSPVLLVYSHRDQVAPVEMGRALQTAAPQATLIPIKKASHVMLTLMPGVNRQISSWLKMQLGPNP